MENSSLFLSHCCIHFFLRAEDFHPRPDYSGGREPHQLTSGSFFSQFVERWVEPEWLQRTDTSTSSWMVRSQSKPQRQPGRSCRALRRGRLNESVPGSRLPGPDREQAPGWPSIAVVGCGHLARLGCSLPPLTPHGVIPPQHF